jgi:1-acyl-sn-glycerol-3-phosphate acyltransferase
MKWLMGWLHYLMSWPAFFVVSALNLVLGVVLQLLTPNDPDRRTCLWVNHHIWGRALFACLPGWPVQRHGFERVGPGPYIVVVNHTSVLDIPLAMSLPGPLLMRALTKAENMQIPIMGRYMRFCKMIPIERGNPASASQAISNCKDTLAKGISLLVFSEGSRSENAQLGPFHRGAFRLAMDTDVPILPVVIYGTHKLLAKGKFTPKNVYSPFLLRVLPPVTSEGFTTARQMSNNVRSLMAEELSRFHPQVGT